LPFLLTFTFRGAPLMITIQGKVLGRKKPLFVDWSIPFPPDWGQDGDRLTLRDLIARIVRSEVAAFRERQQQRQVFHALTARQIEEGAQKGKVTMGGSEIPPQAVDEDEAVATALQAFEDGLYLVVLDGEEQRDLDREIHVQPDSAVTFVRLVMLAGG
jgi:hypothetical protein